MSATIITKDTPEKTSVTKQDTKDAPQKPTAYKLRAECRADCEDFLYTLAKLPGGVFQSQVRVDPQTNIDADLTFTSSLALADLRQILSRQEDAHVMMETIALEANYTGVRV